MKKLFTVIFMAAVCCGAFAQESSELLDKWSNKIEKKDADGISSFGMVNFFYNFDLANVEGQSKHGWGFEVATGFLGFEPWKGGHLALGLIDFSLDFSYARPGYIYSENLEGTEILPGFVTEEILKDANCRWNHFAFSFPLAYVQDLGTSKWQVALMASPGIGWNTYNNKYERHGVIYNDNRNIKKNAYFHLNVAAYVWYDHVGIGVRYVFPQRFQGPGYISAGISLSM